MSRTAILIVDMLKDFFTGSPTLPLVPRANIIGRNARRVVEAARKKGVPLVYVNDCWSNQSEIPIDAEFKLWGPHGIEGTEGAEVIDEIKPERSDLIVRKHRYSGFFNTNLDTILRELDINTCLVMGVHTNCCVQHTVADAFFRGYRTFLIKDCCYAPTEEQHRQGMNYMRTYYGTRPISLEQALNLISGKSLQIKQADSSTRAIVLESAAD